MRDIGLLILFGILVVMILRRPYFGALGWAWISFMSPHRMAYGFAATLPVAMVVAIVTGGRMLIGSDRHPFPWHPITATLIVFICWMSFTTQFALNPDIDSVIYSWVQSLKIFLMLFVTLMLIRGRKQIEQLIWVMVVSIGYFGTKGGIFTITTGGSFRVWGPPGTFIEGNNELALALVTCIPLMYYLSTTTASKWLRRLLWTMMVFSVFSILGSHSRGALVAILAMLTFFILKSNRRVLSMLVLGGALGLALLIMPSEWFERMETITEYQDEGSAMSRINTWKTILNMIQDRPIVGAGYRVGSDLLYQLYSPGPWFKSFDAHSIFFQALGEHGIPGLIIFLSLGWITWRTANRLAKQHAAGPEANWIPLLMHMIQVSLVGFAAGGAFLGLLHFDFPYYLAGIVVLVFASVKEGKCAHDPGPTVPGFK